MEGYVRRGSWRETGPKGGLGGQAGGVRGGDWTKGGGTGRSGVCRGGRLGAQGWSVREAVCVEGLGHRRGVVLGGAGCVWRETKERGLVLGQGLGVRGQGKEGGTGKAVVVEGDRHMGGDGRSGGVVEELGEKGGWYWSGQAWGVGETGALGGWDGAGQGGVSWRGTRTHGGWYLVAACSWRGLGHMGLVLVGGWSGGGRSTWGAEWSERQVLVKAELEKFQQYKDIYDALKKGKLCFSCRTKRFSFFTWSYTCQFCKRPVCSQCCEKMRLPFNSVLLFQMRLPSKPYANLPISSLGPPTTTTLPREEEGGGTSALDTPEKPSSSHHHSLSLRRLSKRKSEGSRDEPDLDLPMELTEDWCTMELTEDWCTMEVCIDCKKFISEIISSSKRSLATKRARLKRKTQSFYMSSANTDDYRPSERTVNEV
ncbi:unnamed protein product [Coregonus sp. 'balchen']|nr:unnamed protein product [Coregonus sp. 'balchen']